VRSLERQQVGFVVARLTSPLRERFDATGFTRLIGEEHFYATVRAAVEACTSSPPRAPGGGANEEPVDCW
jgi:hypothetical protein